MQEFFIGSEITLNEMADVNGVTVDLASATITTIISNPNTAFIVNKSSSDTNQISIASGTSGLFSIYISATESNNMISGIWKINSTIVKGTDTYIKESTIYIKGSVTTNYSIYTIDKTKSVTYAELQTLITNSLLIPSGKYKITDFLETWTGHITGTAEPLVVTALTTNSLELIAFSTTNPLDYIEYSIENTVIEGSIKGCILKRKDSNFNEIGFSFNNTIGIDFYYNIIGYNFYNNIIGNGFMLNNLPSGFIGNVLGNNYNRNDFIGQITLINFTTTYAIFEPHLQATYHCDVFYDSAGVLCLQYVDGDGSLVTLYKD